MQQKSHFLKNNAWGTFWLFKGTIQITTCHVKCIAIGNILLNQTCEICNRIEFKLIKLFLY